MLNENSITEDLDRKNKAVPRINHESASSLMFTFFFSLFLMAYYFRPEKSQPIFREENFAERFELINSFCNKIARSIFDQAVSPNPNLEKPKFLPHYANLMNLVQPSRGVPKHFSSLMENFSEQYISWMTVTKLSKKFQEAEEKRDAERGYNILSNSYSPLLQIVKLDNRTLIPSESCSVFLLPPAKEEIIFDEFFESDYDGISLVLNELAHVSEDIEILEAFFYLMSSEESTLSTEMTALYNLIITKSGDCFTQTEEPQFNFYFKLIEKFSQQLQQLFRNFFQEHSTNKFLKICFFLFFLIEIGFDFQYDERVIKAAFLFLVDNYEDPRTIIFLLDRLKHSDQRSLRCDKYLIFSKIINQVCFYVFFLKLKGFEFQSR